MVSTINHASADKTVVPSTPEGSGKRGPISVVGGAHEGRQVSVMVFL